MMMDGWRCRGVLLLQSTVTWRVSAACRQAAAAAGSGGVVGGRRINTAADPWPCWCTAYGKRPGRSEEPSRLRAPTAGTHPAVCQTLAICTRNDLEAPSTCSAAPRRDAKSPPPTGPLAGRTTVFEIWRGRHTAGQRTQLPNITRGWLPPPPASTTMGRRAIGCGSCFAPGPAIKRAIRSST